MSKKDKEIIIDANTEQVYAKAKTERAKQRAEEEHRFDSVIVKRVDESLRHPDDMLERTIEEGKEQLTRSFFSLLLSSIAAAMILSFTVMATAVISGIAQDSGDVTSRVWVAFVYPLGFILTILCGTQLFTEHTATAIYPVLDKRSSWKSLFRLWFTVILGNLIGALVGALFLISADGVVHAKDGYILLGVHLVSYQGFDIFISALLAGWLMALGAWLLRSSADTMAQVVCIYIVTFIIGLGGLHHSIAGAVEMFVAYFIDSQFTIEQVVSFIGMALFGNLIGGSIFVGVLNYAHIRRTQLSK